jgi:hypothetical protein
MKRIGIGVAMAMLLLGGCSGHDEAQEMAAREAAAKEQADALAAAKAAALVRAQKNCMIAAANNTLQTTQSDSDFGASFEKQDLTNCPNDFTEKFVALGNSVGLYLSNAKEMSAHESQGDLAAALGFLVTARDLYQGKASDDSPMIDWATQGSELKQRAATLRREIEEGIGAVKVRMAHYGVTLQSEPEATPVDETDSNKTGPKIS